MDRELRSFGDFRFDAATGELFRGEDRLSLQNQPAKVLDLLTHRAGRLVTRSELCRALWGEGRYVDHDQGLNYCVREVRRALGDSAAQPLYVETLPRKGYRFLAPVTLDARGARQPAARFRMPVAPATTLVAGLLVGGLLVHESYETALHGRLVGWVHAALALDSQTCPIARRHG